MFEITQEFIESIKKIKNLPIDEWKNHELEMAYERLKSSEDDYKKEINKNYRILSLKWHPDKNPNNKEAEEMMKLINSSYEKISEKYGIYDFTKENTSKGIKDFLKENPTLNVLIYSSIYSFLFYIILIFLKIIFSIIKKTKNALNKKIKFNLLYFWDEISTKKFSSIKVSDKNNFLYSFIPKTLYEILLEEEEKENKKKQEKNIFHILQTNLFNFNKEKLIELIEEKQEKKVLFFKYSFKKKLYYLCYKIFKILISNHLTLTIIFLLNVLTIYKIEKILKN